MRKFIFLLLFVVTATNVFSQEQTYANAIKSEEIANGRRALLDKFIKNDRLGIMLEMDRLIMYADKDYVTLYPIEFWLLSYWLNDYEAVLSSTKALKIDSLNNKEHVRIPPQQDYLALKLIERLKEKKEDIIKSIDNAKLSEEEKNFLQINLKYLLTENLNQNNAQEVLNQDVNDFLASYPNSEYAEFSKKHIRVKYELTKSGFAYSIYSGKFMFTGNLTESYKHPTLLGFTFDVIKKSWLYQLNLGISFTKTKKDMPTDGEVWPQGSKAIGGYVNLSAGKYIIDNKRWAVAPLLGIGVFGLDPNTNEKEPEYKNAGIKTTVAGNIGVTADIKFDKKRNNNIPPYYYQSEPNRTALRIGYEFIASPLKNKYVDYSGSVHKITIGIAFWSRHTQRVY